MPGKATVTVLVDNQPGEGLGAEHGLSYWIEAPGLRILFDTGQSELVRANANKLGVDLSQADRVVLSHGHYDHTGGLEHALDAAPGSVLHCHPAAIQDRFSRKKGGVEPVGMADASRAALEALPQGRIRWTDRPVELTGGIWLSGPIPRKSRELSPRWPFFLDDAASRLDHIEDDMCLWIDSPDGLVVLLGCCHAGLEDTLAHIRAQAPGRAIRTLVGGLHLMDSSAEEITRVLDLLADSGIRSIVPLHCTGGLATSMLNERFGSAVTPGHSGMRLSVSL